MRKLYASENAALVGHLCELLKGRGIDCVVRNWFVSGDAGGSSPLEWPELWVVKTEDEAIAHAYINEATSQDSSSGATEEGPPWRCDDCGASVPAHFACCWSCQRIR